MLTFVCCMKLEKRVQTYIRTQRLFAESDRVLVALSGGADSVALLRMLLRLGYRCHAVHCNFHLRGEESDRDERFVTELCSTLNVPCEIVHFNTKAYALEHHMSIEMAARELRYCEFERIREVYHLDVIAVAHHQDDAVETLLLNLIRGAGINGLTGMRNKNGCVVRPLLCVTRDEVISYLESLEQTYVTDSTNLTDEYARNKVRLNLIPMMQQINTAAKDNILQAAEHLAQAAMIYNKVIAEDCAHIVEQKEGVCTISIEALCATDVPQAYLFEMLHPYGFNSAQVDDIYRSLSSEAGRLFYADEYTVLRDRTHLIVCHRQEEKISEDTEYLLPDEGTLQLPDGTKLSVCRMIPDADWKVPRCSDTLYIDAERIDGALIVRHPREADRFQPFGMRGTKLLSDFYTDIKLPRTEKSRQWILCHGSEIVWAIGKRSSERYRLLGGEKEVIVVSIAAGK